MRARALTPSQECARHVIETVRASGPPEEQPTGGEHRSAGQHDAERRVQIDVIQRPRRRNLSEVASLWKQRIECPEHIVMTIAVAAGDVSAKPETWRTTPMK